MEASARSGVLTSLALAILLPAVFYFWLGDRDLNLSDEGFLWYGVQRTLAGQVPLRDFQSYDPGRYHWCAALAPLFGQGILGVRAASAVFQGLGILSALHVIRRITRGAVGQLAFGLVLMLWMFPQHKLFESATASMAAWVAVRLLERPSAGRHFATGLFVGLAGYFGRNLGLYSGLATGSLVLLSAWRRPERGFTRRCGAWALGVVLGYAPMLGMLAFIPGFAENAGSSAAGARASFADSLRVYLEHGLNAPQPWPWPWRVETSGLTARAAFGEWMESAAFLLPVIALPGLLFAVLRTRGKELSERAACLGPSVVGFFFIHHASVNSGPWHLAQCIQPLLLALIALPVLFVAYRKRVTFVVWSGLALVTLGFTLTSNPALSQTLGRQFVEQRVAGESLKLVPAYASFLAAVERTLTRRVGDEDLFLAPNLPALYCMLEKTSPTWGIYFLLEATPEEQATLAGELSARGVDWAFLERRLFRKTHGLLWQHFEQEWQRVPTPELPPDFVLFQRR